MMIFPQRRNLLRPSEQIEKYQGFFERTENRFNRIELAGIGGSARGRLFQLPFFSAQYSTGT